MLWIDIDKKLPMEEELSEEVIIQIVLRPMEAQTENDEDECVELICKIC